MTIVAEFTIPPEAIPGGSTLADMPDVRIELERIVPTDGAALPFFWLFGTDLDEFLAKLETEPDIEEIQVLATLDNAALFRAMWRPDDDVIQGIRTLQATIMEATGNAGEWHFQVRAENRERLEEFQLIFSEQGIPVQLKRVFNLEEMLERVFNLEGMLDTERLLTEEQRETLLVAYENGYFDQPRQVTQAELGEHFGISSQAVATRLQRGTRNLIQKTLLEASDETDSKSG